MACPASARRPHRRGRAVALCAVLLVVAVAWMHAVASAGVLATDAHHAGGHAARVMADAGPMSTDPPAGLTLRGEPCAAGASTGSHDPPGSGHGAGGHGRGHAGSMCQAPGLGSAPWSPVLLLLPFQPAGGGSRPPLCATVAVDAARGSGCGPPSLAMLSILRT
ncbi:DUF6153 family protein [Dactylosporangium sp. NPDC005572]|uniref:DUF6153 family protein n=1 Tax=Dactylosporangium sp. NPDC005572 TaxID=3156889 RepID=UPI0033AD5DC8